MNPRLFKSAPTLIVAAAVAVTLATGCGDGGGGSPTSPSPTPGVTSVAVVFPAGGTIFIGREVQFEARETLSNGTTRTATGATWGSDAPAVATVSSTGLVRAVSAGEATIFADAGSRGTLRIRVYPSFAGLWGGSEVLTSCQGTGRLAELCAEFTPGDVAMHASSFTQTDATVNASIDAGDNTYARMTGTISVGGELELPSAPVLPADPEVALEVQNWRSRSDVPGAMTGTYEILVTVTGVAGSARVGVRLQNVSRVSTQTALATPAAGATFVSRLRRWRS